MLARGNSKLGSAVYSFSIPIAVSCHSSTPACESVCYAKRGYFHYDNVKATHRRNWRRARSPHFVARMARFIRDHNIPTVRVHAVGDFATPTYTRRWAQIARQCPETTFLAYTRRWQDAKLLPALKAFGSLANVHLWFSADRDTGRPPHYFWSVGTAYMSLTDADQPAYPVSLVFRVSRQGVMKFTKFGDWVCSAEQGVSRMVKITCSTCKYCFSDKRFSKSVPGQRRPRRVSLPLVSV